ncbi:hypothetical protein EVAR_93730_1 [Eumeta japonica]|uniref:Uncharacterized protein n=1 Tax=Eumeta variegata TaxID=151549 RepID=A0A4C1U464_EUMVA|nr:hypothetical protein EVAR_93730_1 [Eumeta japonica]
MRRLDRHTESLRWRSPMDVLHHMSWNGKRINIDELYITRRVKQFNVTIFAFDRRRLNSAANFYRTARREIARNRRGLVKGNDKNITRGVGRVTESPPPARRRNDTRIPCPPP